jgi:hypothetical protein
MNSTPTPKAIEPRDGLIARADEGLAHAYEQIRRADEQLAHVSEQLAKMERDDARPPSAGPGPQSPPERLAAGPGPQSPPRRPALWALVGLPLAACIVVAAPVLQSSYGGGAKLVVGRWAPLLVSTPSLPPENPPFPAHPAPSTVQVAAAEAAAPQATPLAKTAPQDGAPTATAALPDYTQLLQTMARDLANVERNIEQLKANQQNSQRQFKSHRGAQGEPGRDKTRAREGFRAEPAQDVTAFDAADPDLAQTRTDASGAARESAASNSKRVDLRGMVAVDAVTLTGPIPWADQHCERQSNRL